MNGSLKAYCHFLTVVACITFMGLLFVCYTSIMSQNTMLIIIITAIVTL